MPSGCHQGSRRVTQPLCTPSEHHALLFIRKTEGHRKLYSKQLLEESVANKKCGHHVGTQQSSIIVLGFFFLRSDAVV